MKPYKLKHIPTGLYYQPHKHRGSNLSKKGKIYQTGTHGLSEHMCDAKRYPKDTHTVTVRCKKDSGVHKQTKDVLVWKDSKYTYGQVYADTLLTDWVKEEI